MIDLEHAVDVGVPLVLARPPRRRRIRGRRSRRGGRRRRRRGGRRRGGRRQRRREPVAHQVIYRVRHLLKVKDVMAIFCSSMYAPRSA